MKQAGTTQKAQYPQPNFIHGGVRYNLQAGMWKQVKIKGSQHFLYSFLNSGEYDHAIIKKSIFSFIPSSANPKLGALASFNCITQNSKQWQPDQDTNTPPLRKKYSLISYDGRLCMFGGHIAKQQNNQQYFNDLNSFCSYSNSWTPVVKEQNPIVPSPRIPFIFTEVQNGNLLLLGGKNQKGLLKDAFVLKNWAWYELQVKQYNQSQGNFGYIQQILKLQGTAYCSGRNNVYVFGGTDGTKFYNNLYKIQIDQSKFKLKISKVNYDSGSRPCARAFHSMMKLGQTCFAVYGGTNGENLRDLSVFDVNQSKWTEVYPFNGPLPCLVNPKICYDQHSLYFFGSITDKMIESGSRRCVLQITFPEFDIIKSQICANCVKRLDAKQKQQANGPKKPFVSNGLIYNMALQINFPFQAVALLLDCAQALKATQVTIKSFQTINKLAYLDIRFNGKPLSREQYSSIVSHSYRQDPIVLQLIDKLKLGAMRLGKTFLFITIQENLRRIFLFSADSLTISHYDQLYAYFSYQQRITDEWLSTQQSIMHKKFIINCLRSYFDNPLQIINSVTHHCVLILQNNVIMTNQKIYYGQLIASTNDINQVKNRKKVQFLDTIGFQLNQDPQISLVKYIQYLYINANIVNVHVQSKNVKLKNNKYVEELQKLATANKIKNIYKGKLNLKQIQSQCYLYQASNPNQYIKQLKGILVYYQNRLINRFEINFGDLFWQKFYKTKYKKQFGLWTHVGVINILKGAEPKSLRNQFKNQLYYNYFVRHVKKDVLFYKSHTTKIDQMIDEQESRNIRAGEKKVKQ